VTDPTLPLPFTIISHSTACVRVIIS
jgi:hypothetical protein